MSETARYLYAVTRPLDPGVVAGHRGLEDGPVEVVEHDGLAVLVSTVSLEEFGEEALKRNLERLDWLEETARTHDRVVRLAADQGPTAPMRLVTICHDDAAVRERLDAWHDRLVAALLRVQGRHEWSVKAFASPPPEQDSPAVAPAGAGGGAAYLRARKAALESRHSHEEDALRTAAEIDDVLGLLAVASRRLPPQDARLSGRAEPMTLNAAYLVEDEDAAVFATEIERLGEQHPDVQLSVGGPWPPYSFATLEES